MVKTACFFRLAPEAVKLLTELANATGKTKTSLLEEQIGEAHKYFFRQQSREILFKSLGNTTQGEPQALKPPLKAITSTENGGK